LQCAIGSENADRDLVLNNIRASLLDIEGGIGTGVDNGAWISTSYLIGAPIQGLNVGDLEALTGDEAAALMDLTRRATVALKAAYQPDGVNVGMNLGTVAGAGIAAHLHQHVVPRWGGDSNFMPVVGRTRVLPQLLADTRKILADAWPAAAR